jgi:hypothetical protein
VLRKWVSRFDLWPYVERFALDTERELRAELGEAPPRGPLACVQRPAQVQRGTCPASPAARAPSPHAIASQSPLLTSQNPRTPQPPSKGGKPDLIIGNYSDGNLVASLLAHRMFVTQCNIAHALEKTKYQDADIKWWVGGGLGWGGSVVLTVGKGCGASCKR